MENTWVGTVLLRIPYTAGTGTAIANDGADAMNMLLVRVDTADGASGWGEAFGHSVCRVTQEAIDTVIAPQLLGRDAADINGISHNLQQMLHIYGRSGSVRYGVSGIKIALWDIAGKQAGLPFYRLFGRGERNRPLPPRRPANARSLQGRGAAVRWLSIT
jgi:L-alanine-DL-glutamate epimerase-like enolase superfamily enzyme